MTACRSDEAGNKVGIHGSRDHEGVEDTGPWSRRRDIWWMGLNERDFGARAEEACGQVRKTQTDRGQCQIMPGQGREGKHYVQRTCCRHALDRDLERFIPARASIAQSRVGTSASEAIDLLGSAALSG